VSFVLEVNEIYRLRIETFSIRYNLVALNFGLGGHASLGGSALQAFAWILEGSLMLSRDFNIMNRR